MTKDAYIQQQRDGLEKIRANALDELENIEQWPESEGRAALDYLISCACQAQNYHVISGGRAGLKRLPLPWLVARLPAQIAASINLEDEWEFRRLLEALEELSDELLLEYAALGLASSDSEIREASQDFLDFYSRRANH